MKTAYDFFMILKYPKHFYEPIRREIAISQMQHDLRKLLPSAKEEQWQAFDRDITQWFEGEDYELEPVHDFWNFFGGFSRELKLKSLIFWITAENVNWIKKEVKVDDIIITWDFPGLEFMGKAPYQAKLVRNYLNRKENKILKKSLLEDSKYRSGRYLPRDQFPIVLFYDSKGGVINSFKGYSILEGNRRTVKTIVEGGEKILAYVGQFKNKDDNWPKNFWIRTGMLRDLIFLAIDYDREDDEKAFRTVRNFYQLLLRDFDLARVATFDKSFKNFETNQRLREELLMEDFK